MRDDFDNTEYDDDSVVTGDVEAEGNSSEIADEDENSSKKEALDIKASDSEEEIEDESKNKRILKEVWSWVKVFLFAFIFAFVLTHFVIVNANIPSGSMESTINTGDKVIGFRWSYVLSKPARKDIVMFYAPEATNTKKGTIYIKRIIGIPGDTIEIDQENLQLYVNGKLQKESYVDSWLTPNGGDPEAPRAMEYNSDTGRYTITLGKNEYFMMGDNRGNSNDSRYWGTVKKSEIIAKAIFRYMPSFKILK